MKPRIVVCEAFHVVGLRERFLPGKVEGIPMLWDRFIRRAGEVQSAIPGVTYGVCVSDRHYGTSASGEAGAAPAFDYTAGIGVTSLDAIPQGMSGVTVPGGTFAVFTHHGTMPGFHKTIAAIWREWIPASGLKPTGAPDFERYDERFRHASPTSEMDVYVPVVAP